MTSAAQIMSVIATAYGLAASLSSLLQTRQMLRRGTSRDVSLGFLGSYVGGYGIWLVYGVTIHSLPVIVVHAVGLVTGLITLGVALSCLRPSVAPAETR